MCKFCMTPVTKSGVGVLVDLLTLDEALLHPLAMRRLELAIVLDERVDFAQDVLSLL
jgi:hypothetical protein